MLIYYQKYPLDAIPDRGCMCCTLTWSLTAPQLVAEGHQFSLHTSKSQNSIKFIQISNKINLPFSALQTSTLR